MKSKLSSIIEVTFLFTGIILTIFAIDLFRLTFIPVRISLGIYFIAGIIGFLIYRRRFSGIYKSKGFNLITSIICTVGSFGGLFVFLFLAFNFYLADKEITKEHFTIIETGKLPKGGKSNCSNPYVIIQRDSLKKQLIFKCDQSKDVFFYKSIDLIVSKGKLGYFIIRERQFTNE